MSGSKDNKYTSHIKLLLLLSKLITWKVGLKALYKNMPMKVRHAKIGNTLQIGKNNKKEKVQTEVGTRINN